MHERMELLDDNNPHNAHLSAMKFIDQAALSNSDDSLKQFAKNRTQTEEELSNLKKKKDTRTDEESKVFFLIFNFLIF